MRIPNPNGHAISWGVRELDSTLGPIILGRLYLVIARPQNGKTTFVMNWLDRHVDRLRRARQAASTNPDDDFYQTPRKIQLFLTERSPEITAVTWAALRAGLDADAVINGNWDDLPPGSKDRWRAEWETLDEWAQDGYVSFEDISRPTAGEIERRVSEYDPDIVVFDHIQRVRPEARQTKFEAVGEAAHMFQSFATQGNRAVLVMSQIKRTGDKVFGKYRPPSDEDAKMAGEIEEDADVQIGLFRPLKKMTVQEERAIRHGEEDLERFKVRGMIGVSVPKHRWKNSAVDKLLFLKIANGRIEDRDPVPF
jgi:replicative DNA helicase